MQIFKEILISAILAVLAFIEPIQADLMTLFLIFLLNSAMGFLADKLVFKAEFSFVKAFRSIYESLLFFCLVLVIFLIGTIKSMEESALTCVSFVTYVVLYFYGVNILRNLKIIVRKDTPPYRVISFLYYVVQLEFIDKIPLLKEYLNTEIKE